MSMVGFAAPVPDRGARRSQAERVRAELWEQILTVRLRPGQTLVESELAQEHGVSKTPVREALQTLAAQGLVRVLPRKGYVVSSLDLQDVREVMDLRLIIEPPLIGLAAHRVTDELLSELRGLLTEQFSPSATLEDRLDAAHRFHATAVRASGNRRAAAVVETLSFQIRRLHYLMPSVRAHVSSATEHDSHHAILDGIAAGDSAEASAQMRRHLTESDEAMVTAFYDSAGLAGSL